MYANHSIPGVLCFLSNVSYFLEGTPELVKERLIQTWMMCGIDRERVMREYINKETTDKALANTKVYEGKLKSELQALKSKSKFAIATIIRHNWDMFFYSLEKQGLKDAIIYQSPYAFNAAHPERKEPSMILVIFDLSKIKE